MKTLLVFLLLASTAAFAEETLATIPTVPGKVILTPLRAAPFPHPSRAEGHKYKDEFFPAAKHYSDNTVAFFIPEGYRPEEKVDFVIHFHGWRNSVRSTLANYRLTEQMLASGKNAILIVPEGPRDAPDSSGGKLEDADGFKRFMAETLTVLKGRGVIATNAELGKVILAGHSGGYQVISSIVTVGGLPENVREVWLFDALYAQSEKFLAWADKTGGRLLNIYTDGGGTKVRTEEMMATLRAKQKALLATNDQAVNLNQLRTNQYVFLHTDLKHNEVVAVRHTFQDFLETSCLSPRLDKAGEASRLIFPYPKAP